MSREKQMWIWIGAFALFLALLYALSGVLTPFVAGLAVAYFLDPLNDRLEALVKSRSLSTALILLAFFVIAGLLGMALFPLLQGQVMGLIASVPDFVDAARGLIEPTLKDLESHLGAAEMQQIKDAASAFAGQAIGWIADVLRNLFLGGKAVVNTLSLVLIMPVVAFFLLRDWDILVAKVDGLLPRSSAGTIRAQFKKIDETIAGFVRGQAMVCLILGTIYGTGLTLVGLDFGLLIGIGTGLLAFVPYVGMMIGLIVAFAIALVQFTDVLDFVLVALVFGVGQGLDAAFLTPNLVGGRVNLHPVWIIFALMAGGTLFGFTGVLLAVPTAAVIGVLVRFAIGRYRESVLYSGGAGG